MGYSFCNTLPGSNKDLKFEECQGNSSWEIIQKNDRQARPLDFYGETPDDSSEQSWNLKTEFAYFIEYNGNLFTLGHATLPW